MVIVRLNLAFHAGEERANDHLLSPIPEVRSLSETEPERVAGMTAWLTGQDLAQQPDVAAKLSRACITLKNHILDPSSVSQLTGRLKRRVVLD